MIYPTKKLGEICEIVTGSTPKTKHKEYYGDDFLWACPADLDQGKYILKTKKMISKIGVENGGTRRVPKNSTMMCCIGSVGKLSITTQNMSSNQQINTFIPNTKIIEPLFLYYSLKNLQDVFLANASKTTLPIINKSRCSEIPIPLPPVEIQKKIVERIEKMMAKIDEAKKLRKEALADASALIPSALNKIFEEGERNGWEDVKVGDVCEKPQYGYTESAKLEAVGPKFLRITDIQNGNVDWKNVPYCFCNDIEKYQLKNGDIVFARTGATVGKSYLIKDSPKNAIFASYLIRLRATEKILPDFLYYFFQSPDYWRQITQGQVGGAQPNVNGTKLAKIKFPLPPLPEQNKIVKYLDSLSEKVRKIQSLQSASEKELKLLEKGDFEGGVLWYN